MLGYMLGIYKIENLINGKVYIGQSVNLKSRITKHKCNSIKEIHRESNKPLYRAIRKYGIDNFSFEIIYTCDNKESLNKLELYYINQYSSNIPKYGYNLNLIGSYCTFKKLDSNILHNIVKDLKGELTKRKIFKKYNISSQLLNSINRGDVNRLSSENYPIRVETDLDLLKKKSIKCLNCNRLTNNFKFCSIKCSSEKQRKVTLRPSKDELLKLLETSTYVEVGKMFNVSDNSIRKWIKNN